MKLTNTIRVERVRLWITQGELAKAVGCSINNISKIENDFHSPLLPLAMRLANYFNLTVEELFTFKNK